MKKRDSISILQNINIIKSSEKRRIMWAYSIFAFYFFPLTCKFKLCVNQVRGNAPTDTLCTACHWPPALEIFTTGVVDNVVLKRCIYVQCMIGKQKQRKVALPYFTVKVQKQASAMDLILLHHWLIKTQTVVLAQGSAAL